MNEECQGVDPVLRVDQMDGARNEPVTVTPDASLEQAVTLMLTHDFSQMPVLSGPRELKGVISWKTIGSRMVLGREGGAVRDYMEAATTLASDASLFDAVQFVADNDYVVVRDKGRKVVGILTASDFSLQFRALAEPFLLIGEIEQGMRLLLEGKFPDERLAQLIGECGGSSRVQGIDDLTFGDYVALLQRPAAWDRLRIDRKIFTEKLDDVRRIRNNVMHFKPNGLEAEQVEDLRAFARFMRRLRDVIAG